MGSPIILLDHITVRRRDRVTLDDVSLTVDRGDFVAITGPNGGGKTTLLKVLLRLLAPSAGTVTYFGMDGKPARRLGIGYLPQKNAIDSKFPITVGDLVASGLMGRKDLSAQDCRRLTDSMVARVGLSRHAGAPIGTLSGGQMQRALIGRALIGSPEVLVLDEPLSYVDKQFEHTIYEIVAEASRRATILLVSHEMSTIAGMANRHVVVDRTLTQCHAAHHTVHYDCNC